MLFCIAACVAQNTLNIHQKSGGVVSYGFADKPVVTYEGETLHLSTDKVSIDYPLAELEMLNFDDSEAAIGELRVDGPKMPVFVFRMDGMLVKRMEDTEESSSIDINELPAGTYIIKQGSITYKMEKQ